MILQNAPGDVDWPVRAKREYGVTVAQQRRARSPRASNARVLLLTLPGVALAAVGAVLLKTFEAVVPDPDLAFLGIVGLCAVAIILPSVLAARRDRDLPRREQLRYGESSPTITPRQQQLLALDGASDYSIGGWNSSLEYWPGRIRRDTAAPVAGRRAEDPFLTFSEVPLEQVRAELDQRNRVVNRETLELYIADTLSTAGVSARFLAVLRGPQADRAASRIAALCGIDEWTVRARIEPRPERPPLLLWAGDAQRAIAAVRMAFLAGYVTEAESWELLERIGELAFAVHRDWDEYWESSVISVAFASDSLEQVERFGRAVRDYRASAWPGASAPFDARSPETLPAHVRHPIPALLEQEAPDAEDR